MATAEFSKCAAILSEALSQHHLSGFEIAQLEFLKQEFLEQLEQETPGVTGKFGLGIRNEAGQSLIEFYQENALVVANTLFQQHKRRLYTWTSPDGQHRNQIDYIPLYSCGVGCNFSFFISDFIDLGPLPFFLDEPG